jgi:hypothetical protein
MVLYNIFLADPVVLCENENSLQCSTHYLNSMISHDSSVSKVSSYKLDYCGPIPDKGRIFLFTTKSKPALGQTQPPIQWILEVKWSGCDATPSAGVENNIPDIHENAAGYNVVISSVQLCELLDFRDT